MVNPNTETSEKQTQYIMPSEIESNLHILAQSEHRFRSNVNADSG